MDNPISFDNTAIAFAHKTDKELKDAHRLFRMMGRAWLVKIGTRLAPWSIKIGLPVKGMIRKTIFKQFVGGETLQGTSEVVGRLAQSHVEVILDYGVEGKENEAAFDAACEEFIRVINYAADQPNIPYMSIKVTAFASFALLEKIDGLMKSVDCDQLQANYQKALHLLSPPEIGEWKRVYKRMLKICEAAMAANVGVLVDAEESWVQDPVDALTMAMMAGYNRSKTVLFNTIQLYRHDRLSFLKCCYALAEEKQFLLGVKLVRGAYMEKERKRAAAKNYPSPIQPNKKATDADYNKALQFCIERLQNIDLIIASHNEESNWLATQLLLEKGLPLHHHHVHFSQLYGMSDNITFNLAKAGCRVSKYLPFGPIQEVVPYLMRRAQENTSVGGQTSRELSLITKELERRGLES